MRTRRQARPTGGPNSLSSLSRLVGEGVRPEIVEIVANFPSEVVADQGRGYVDRVCDALGVRAAVTLHDETIQAKKDCAIVIVRIEVVLEQVKGRTGQREPGLRAERAL